MLVSSALFRETLITAGIMTVLADAKCKLYKNDVTPNPNSVVGLFAECDFPGYADVEDLLYTYFTDPFTLNLVAYPQVPLVFNAGVIVTPQEVFGWYVTNTAGTGLLMSGRFNETVNVTATGQAIILETEARPMFPLTQPEEYVGNS